MKISLQSLTGNLMQNVYLQAGEIAFIVLQTVKAFRKMPSRLLIIFGDHGRQKL